MNVSVEDYTLVVLKSALRIYIKNGIKVNKHYTPTNMLKKAGEITGKNYKRGQLQIALDDLQAEFDSRLKSHG